ncbi:MAG: XRE family transcriptional regulator [Desulfurellales bacterium]|nr:MAG: XRE family transcriptional regulator [Desulfurellales bacterium]
MRSKALTKSDLRDVEEILRVLVDFSTPVYTAVPRSYEQYRFAKRMQCVVPDHSSIGRRLRTIRTTLKLTLNEMQDKTGISLQHLSALERGLRRWNAELVDSYVRALHVCVDSAGIRS